MNVLWFSAGVSSAVSLYLSRNELDRVFYNPISDQEPDTERFIEDVSKACSVEVERLSSERFSSVEDVARYYRFLNSPGGAPCSKWLKKDPRKRWERGRTGLVYYWGFDKAETARALNVEEAMPGIEHRFPLIDSGLSKKEAHGFLRDVVGVRRPLMYDLGFSNNNCVGCVKGGMGYWNKIRQDFPEVFESRARLERDLGSHILKECFLDELEPARGRVPRAILPECGIFCERGGFI